MPSKTCHNPGNCRGAITNLLANIITLPPTGGDAVLFGQRRGRCRRPCSGRSNYATSQAAAISFSVVRFLPPRMMMCPYGPPARWSSVRLYPARNMAGAGALPASPHASIAIRTIFKADRPVYSHFPMDSPGTRQSPSTDQTAINRPVTISRKLWWRSVLPVRSPVNSKRRASSSP